MSTLLVITIVMVAGLLSTRLMKVLHLPNVTGYLIIGLVIGPSCLNIVSNPTDYDLIVNVALGFIAFSIGSEFTLGSLKKIGKKITIITFFQAFCALLFVFVTLTIVCLCMKNFKENLALILVLSAVATATAPAATLMVIKQYKAHGETTDTLLFVVALDDAFGLMFFSVAFALAKVFANGESLTFVNVALLPLLEIALSLLIGAILGVVLAVATKFFKSRANRLGWMITIVFAGVALCELLPKYLPCGLSSLLLCMMAGAVFCNLRKDSITILDGIERWTPPLFMLFFIISSAELDLAVVPTVGIIGICYILARSLGKYSGAFMGGKIVHAEDHVTKYLGLALLPQAGVAIGMAKIASAGLQEGSPDISAKITAIVLCATLIYELIGPVCSKFALVKAGDIVLPEKKIKKNKIETA